MKRATTTFFGPDNVSVVEGSIYDDKSPIVKAWPHLFEDAAEAASRSAAAPPTFGPADFAHLADTTARPGRKRGGSQRAEQSVDVEPADDEIDAPAADEA